MTAHLTPSREDLDAALLLLSRMGIDPADLTQAVPERPPAPVICTRRHGDDRDSALLRRHDVVSAVARRTTRQLDIAPPRGRAATAQHLDGNVQVSSSHSAPKREVTTVVSALDRLISLVPPPAMPVDGDGDWQRVEARLGLALPADFKELLRRYGVGQFDDINLLTPFDTHPDAVFDLVDYAEALISWYDDLREDDPENFPFRLYPEEGGLLPWAKTGDGTDLCWLAKGRPDDWPTAVWNVREGGYRYDRGAVDLLYGYLSGQACVELLSPPPDVPWFDRYRERREVRIALADGEVPSADRLRILREHLAPTADRRSVENEVGRRTDNFKAVDRDWLLTFLSGDGPDGIVVRFPPEDDAAARTAVATAVQAMGSRITRAISDRKPVWS